MLHSAHRYRRKNTLRVRVLFCTPKQMPDLIAMDTNKNFYVVEAKGTLGRCKSKELIKALNQVCSIRTINGRFPYKRYVSYFIGEKSTPILVAFIDPKEQGQIDVRLDLNRLIEFHYQKLLQILFIKKEFQKLTIGEFCFKGITIEMNSFKEVFSQDVPMSIFIGLEEKIFNYLVDIKRNSEIRQENCEKIIKRSRHLKKLIKDKSPTKETISLGMDGIIVKWE